MQIIIEAGTMVAMFIHSMNVVKHFQRPDKHGTDITHNNWGRA